MYAKTALIAALAGSATAIIDIRPNRIRRDVLPSQTELSADPCLNALGTVYANAPTAPPKILSYEMTAPPQTDPCSVTVPADLSADYSSYTSEVLSWVDANSASIASALSFCSTLTDLETEIPVCTATRSVAAASGSSAPKTTAGGDSPSATSEIRSGAAAGTGAGASATDSSSSPSQIAVNAGPRETGMIAAAALAAGFVGVAAFL
ncbi:infection structure specific protein [Colletotrichum orchidophilum]|uniref:Infection structure specific protein n=1 Tax=Colletotrichum orchidophilum TaxID=1209926 RepID=A0A1G4BGI5_9PEZI|nr:infection structure specific protein [Colletotrichum orchidophilum]OHF00458.1 infection structure specific protein [Colletotrichum orchidophilum]